MAASPAGMPRAAAINSPSASSAVAAEPPLAVVVLLTTIPRALQAAMSSDEFCGPVIPSIRKLRSWPSSDAGRGVRSRIERMMSKDTRAAAAASSLSNASRKKTTSARASSLLQSALCRATPCQSSRTATLVIRIFSSFNNRWVPAATQSRPGLDSDPKAPAAARRSSAYRLSGSQSAPHCAGPSYGD